MSAPQRPNYALILEEASDAARQRDRAEYLARIATDDPAHVEYVPASNFEAEMLRRMRDRETVSEPSPLIAHYIATH